MKRLFGDIRLAFLLIIKARFLLLTGGAVFALSVTVLLSAQFSGRQPAAVAMDIGFSFIRLALPVLIALLLQELVSKELERKYYLSSFTYPHSRALFLIGRLIAAGLFTLTALAVMSIVLAALVSLIQSGYDQSRPVSFGLPYLTSLAFLGVDLLALLAIASLLAVVATTPGFVLVGTLGFMLIARSFYPIIQLLSENEYVVADAEQYRRTLGGLAYFFPDLSRLDLRVLPIYDSMEYFPSDAIIVVASVFAYSMGLFGCGVWLLNRRRLS